MEKLSRIDHVRNEEVLLITFFFFFYQELLSVNYQWDILHEIRNRKANWIGHIIRRNCLLKQVIEGKIKDKGIDGSDKKARKKT
jgi:hypothetical protein